VIGYEVAGLARLARRAFLTSRVSLRGSIDVL
jgi:hypothetical protein